MPKFEKELNEIRKKYPNAKLTKKKLKSGTHYLISEEKDGKRTIYAKGINNLRILEKPYSISLL